jgi:hypothetical protein
MKGDAIECFCLANALADQPRRALEILYNAEKTKS